MSGVQFQHILTIFLVVVLIYILLRLLIKIDTKNYVIHKQILRAILNAIKQTDIYKQNQIKYIQRYFGLFNTLIVEAQINVPDAPVLIIQDENTKKIQVNFLVHRLMKNHVVHIIENLDNFTVLELIAGRLQDFYVVVFGNSTKKFIEFMNYAGYHEFVRKIIFLDPNVQNNSDTKLYFQRYDNKTLQLVTKLTFQRYPCDYVRLPPLGRLSQLPAAVAAELFG